jgi:hypothetical protein
MAWKPASGQEPRGLSSHLEDLQLMGGVSRAVIFFVVIRLGLGLFGHDFYELYWWFAAGLLLALNRLQVTAAHRTIHYLESAAPVQPAQTNARPI